MPMNAKSAMDRFNTLKSNRENWETHWQEDYMVC